MTDPREALARIRAQADAATEGPWELLGDGEYVSGPGILVAPDDGGVTSADAEFIAAARDPLTIAREVLDLTHEDETVTVCSVPDNKAAALARAVLRVEELADRLDDGHLRHLIRTTLNGETDG